MSLDVTFEITTGAATQYRLKCETASLSYDRPVIIIPLPGAVSPKLLDLGGMNIRWTLEGQIDDAEVPTDGGLTIPTKTQLEDAVTGWWNETVKVTISGDAYNCKVMSFKCSLMGGRQDWWNYSLMLAAEKKQ